MLSSKGRLSAGLLLGLFSLTVSGQSSRPILSKGVGFEQKLRAQLPLDTMFRDEQNAAVPLSDYFGKVPVFLALVYFRCPNVCDLTLNEMVTSLKHVALQPGSEYNVVVISIDPSETPQLAAEKKASYGKLFGRSSFGAGWHFLTGPQASIAKVASAAGFTYRWDERTKQFVHGVGMMVATPEGELSRYFYGIQYAPADMRLAVAEASQGKISSPVNAVLLFCFHYDATQGRYTLAIFNLLKVAGTLTVLALGILIYVLTRGTKVKSSRWKEAQHVA